MHIWVDADACPYTTKEILFRASKRTQIPMTLVANKLLYTPSSPLIKAVQVSKGFDVADAYIAEHVQPEDLVITADIPLAAEVVAKKATALNPRGELYTQKNIQQRLSMRNFMEEMRTTGEISGGPKTLGKKDSLAFANALDRWLAST